MERVGGGVNAAGRPLDRRRPRRLAVERVGGPCGNFPPWLRIYPQTLRFVNHEGSGHDSDC